MNNNKLLLESLDLPIIESFNDLVNCLRLSPKLLYWLTSSSKERYIVYNIPKKNGTLREISAPVYCLKVVQKWILNNILYKIATSPYSYGFKKGSKGSPLLDCAVKHKNNMFILKMDIKNFYPSISKKKVFFQFLNIGYNKNVANILANLCTFNGILPQGAVTSACMANLICNKLDCRLAGYCEKNDISFCRYADDLTFSSDNRNSLKKTYHVACKIINDEDFKVNDGKTHFMTPKCKKSVLGININDNQIKIPKEMKKKLRSMIHYSIVTGDYTNIDKIRGYISYISSIEQSYKKKVYEYITKLTESSLCINTEIVDEYNKNKFFSDLPDMQLKKATDFANDFNTENFLNNERLEHEQYLSNHN